MSALTDLLLQGPQSALALRTALKISQATFSRLVATEPQVLQFGKARATRYALLRPVRGIERFALRRIDEQGHVYKWGELHTCWPQGSCLVTLEEGGWQWFDGLPWYLTDLRPQGFLGRSWGRNIARQFGLPEDIHLWQEEDVLFALSVFSGENPGGWLIGDASYQRWVQTMRPTAIAAREKVSAYAAFASDALEGEIIGSSAGGEQPKFTCFAQTETGPAHVLVKFTAPQVSASSQRWGDLLVAESIALNVLRAANIPASAARVLSNESRQVFLESVRFDCVGTEGRRAIVSLEALKSEYAPVPGTWPKSVAELASQRLVGEEVVAQTEQLWAFGRLIANSDMHAGNLSFYFSAPPMGLTPVYDMLPMAFAPASSGAMRSDAIELALDTSVSKAAWSFAIPLAQRFWQTVAADERISEAFHQIARQMGDNVAQLERIAQRLA